MRKNCGKIITSHKLCYFPIGCSLCQPLLKGLEVTKPITPESWMPSWGTPGIRLPWHLLFLRIHTKYPGLALNHTVARLEQLISRVATWKQLNFNQRFINGIASLCAFCRTVVLNMECRHFRMVNSF
jgi:hypothetical protein